MDNDFFKQFESKPLFEADIGGIVLFIFDNRINYIVIPSFQRLTICASKKIESLVIEFYSNKKERCCNIVEYKVGASIDTEAREWVASRKTESTAVSDAIVIASLAQKILSNLYLYVNRPKKSAKFFNNLEDAISWSLEQLKNEN